MPRHAASLIVLRDSARGAEMLMGVRGARHRFMPNRLVFPGGAVDREDFAAPCASALRLPVRRHLARIADAALAQALAIAAARELEEETGLSLGRPPRLDALDFLCRAITPAAQPLRFDASFFVAPAEAACGAIAGSGELEGVRFYPVTEALALDLAPVTRGVLGRLMEWRVLTPAARDARLRLPVLREEVWGVA